MNELVTVPTTGVPHVTLLWTLVPWVLSVMLVLAGFAVLLRTSLQALGQTVILVGVLMGMFALTLPHNADQAPAFMTADTYVPQSPSTIAAIEDQVGLDVVLYSSDGDAGVFSDYVLESENGERFSCTLSARGPAAPDGQLAALTCHPATPVGT